MAWVLTKTKKLELPQTVGATLSGTLEGLASVQNSMGTGGSPHQWEGLQPALRGLQEEGPPPSPLPRLVLDAGQVVLTQVGIRALLHVLLQLLGLLLQPARQGTRLGTPGLTE